MIIHLIGTPGSGKSHLCRQTLKNEHKFWKKSHISSNICLSKMPFSKASLKAFNKKQMKNFYEMSSQNPALYKYIWEYIHLSQYSTDFKGNDIKLITAVRFFDSFLEFDALKRSKYSLNLLDEGPLHKLLNIYDKEIDDLLIKILENLTLPDAIIHCDPPTEIILQRSEAKKNYNFKNANTDTIKKETERKIEGAQFIRAFYEHKTPIFHITTSSPDMDRLADFLDTLKKTPTKKI